MSSKRKSKQVEKDAIGVVESKYKGISFDESVISIDVLCDICFRGWCSPDIVKEALAKSRLFAEVRTLPAWRVVWSGVEVRDDEFEAGVARLNNEFKALSYTDEGELLHVFGLRLWLADIGCLPGLDRKGAAQSNLQYIDDARAKGVLPKLAITMTRRGWDVTGAHGCGFYDHESSEFKEVKDALRSAQVGELKARAPAMMDALLSDLKDDVEKFGAQIVSGSSGSGIYAHTAILHNIDPVRFVSAIEALPPKQQKELFRYFAARYEHGNLSGELSDERDWVKRVRDLWVKQGTGKTGIAKFRYERFDEWYLRKLAE
jgi:hypothetical protein